MRQIVTLRDDRKADKPVYVKNTYELVCLGGRRQRLVEFRDDPIKQLWVDVFGESITREICLEMR